MKIFIVGIGMEGEKTLTADAKKAIESADVLIGAKRVTDPFAALGKPVFECSAADGICAFLGKCGKETAAVLMSGDCGFYSGARLLTERLSGSDTEVLPGISTPVYLAAKLGIPWQDMRFVSLHGRSAGIVRNVRRYGKCFFLLGGSVTPSDICKRLCEYGMSDIAVNIGVRLAYPDERIISGTAGELSEVRCDPLCAAVTVNPYPEALTQYGIPDGELIRGNVPMTKSEIRAVVASKLKVCYNDTVWDIGCGTGSVSVECALAANDGTVIAIDRNADAAALTAENAHKFGCDNITVVHGEAPDALWELPKPDEVFIGGAGGNIAAVLDAALAGGSSPRVVITAVTPETLHEAMTALRERGMTVDVTQISAVRTKLVGSHRMFDAQNPVFIIEGAAV